MNEKLQYLLDEESLDFQWNEDEKSWQLTGLNGYAMDTMNAVDRPTAEDDAIYVIEQDRKLQAELANA